MGTTIFVKSNSENLFKDALLITNTTQVFLSMKAVSLWRWIQPLTAAGTLEF